MMQIVLASLLVAGAAIYAIWALVPAQRRLQTLQRLQYVAAKSAWLAPLERILAKKLAKLLSTNGGCGSCSSSPPRKPG